MKSSHSKTLSADEIVQFVDLYSGISSSNLLMNLLSYKPYLPNFDGVWRNLNRITVRDLLGSPMRTKEGMLISGEALLTAIIQSIVHEFADIFLSCIYGPINMDYSLIERDRIILALSQPETRAEAVKTGYQMLADVLDKPVIDAIRISKLGNDLYTNNQEMTPDDCSSRNGKALIYLKEVFPGYLLSVFRRKLHLEAPSYGAIHEVFSTIHTPAGELIGSCSVDFVKNPDGSMSSLGQLLDEGDCTESAELAMSVCAKVMEHQIDQFETRHAAFVFDWEVSADHQGRGLGKALLNAALQEGSKGLGRPDTVFASLHPLSFPVPPYEDAVARVYEYENAKNEIVTIWNKCTNGSTTFGNSRAEFYEGRYQKLYHMIGNCQILGLSFFMGLDF